MFYVLKSSLHGYEIGTDSVTTNKVSVITFRRDLTCEWLCV